jgi:hypothetical protein
MICSKIIILVYSIQAHFTGRTVIVQTGIIYIQSTITFCLCKCIGRQAIQSGKVPKYPELPPLSEEQRLGIFSISDMYDLNEISCLDYWIAASDENNRRWLEEDLGQTQSYFEHRLVNTVVTMYEHDRLCLLEAVGLIFKSRHDLNLSAAKQRAITRLTNRLLQAGIITNIIYAIKVGLVEKISFRSIDFIRECLLLLADDCFISTYLVQLTTNEYEELVSAIQSVSEIITVSHLPDKNDWKLNTVLVVLQVTQISVLEQRATFYDRQDSSNLLASSSDSKSEGNSLYQQARSKDGLDSHWPGCKGIKGVSCIAHAVLRQPMVDAERADIADVIWFMQEAYQLRAYSYLRLCIIPALQSRGVGNRDIQPLLCGVVSQLLLVSTFLLSLSLAFHSLIMSTNNRISSQSLICRCIAFDAKMATLSSPMKQSQRMVLHSATDSKTFCCCLMILQRCGRILLIPSGTAMKTMRWTCR